MTYIETDTTKILLDAGISLRAVKTRSDVDISAIDAILVTHEHIDHVKFLEKLALASRAPIYINKDSFLVARERFFKGDVPVDVRFIEPNKKYKIGDINILTLNLNHDSKSCYGYIFLNKGRSLAYCTDTGFLPLPYIELLKNVDSLILEANHDIELLENCNRPWELKQRILSVSGHMSNKICGEILNEILKAKKLKRVVLAHMSEECNTEDLALTTIKETIKGAYFPEIAIAHQHQATDLFEV